MFSYCLNNPLCYNDSNGYWGVPNGIVNPSAMTYKSGKYMGWITPDAVRSVPDEDSSFALIQETSEVSCGTKVATFLGGEFDLFGIDNDNFNLLNFEITAVSIDLVKEPWTYSLFNLGNISAYAGLKSGIPAAGAMISIWSPAVAYTVGDTDFVFSLHFGAAGADFAPGGTSGKFGFAQGIGFSLSWS